MRSKNVSDPTIELRIKPSLNRLFIISIVLLSGLLYVNTLQNGFVLDDSAVITQNKYVQQGFGGIKDILSTHHWAGYWDTQSGLYRPLSLIMFALEQEIFGSVAWPWHLVNIILFIVTVVLLYDILKRIFEHQQPLLLYITTLLFIAHPIHTEVVANIKSADELLSFLFILLTFKVLTRHPERQTLLNYLLSGIFFFLALLSKETAITFILIIPLLIYYMGAGKIQVKSVSIIFFNLAIFASVYFILRFIVLGSGFAGNVRFSIENTLVLGENFWERLPSAFGLLVTYTRLLLFPDVLSFDYSYNQFPLLSWNSPMFWLGALLFAGLCSIVIKYIRSKSIPAIAILYFFITYSVVSNAFILIGTTLGERLLYVPSVGFCLLLAWGLCNLNFSKLNKMSPLFLTLIIVILYGFKTIDRNSNWKDNLSLAKEDIKNAPNSWKTHYCYGTALYSLISDSAIPLERKNELLQLAVNEYRVSYSIDTNNFLLWFPLAKAEYMAGNYPSSVRLLRKYTELYPSDIGAFEYKAYALARNGMYPEAIQSFKYCISKGRQNADIFLFLGLSQIETANNQEATISFLEALNFRPGDPSILSNLGSAYAREYNYAKAIHYYKQAFAVNPSNEGVLRGLANAYLSTNKKDSSEYYLSLIR